jgi:hypothetical protein
VVQYLVEHGVPLDIPDKVRSRRSICLLGFRHALGTYLMRELRLCLVTEQFGRLAHCSAAINGHLDVVKYLIEECPQPIEINAIDEVQRSPTREIFGVRADADL